MGNDVHTNRTENQIDNESELMDLDWQKVTFVPLGGLTEVGFSKDESYVLVISNTGRGVINSSSGEYVARNYDIPNFDSQWIQKENKLVKGIGPVSEEWIAVAGLWGGELKQGNSRTWTAYTKSQGVNESAYIANQKSGQQVFVGTFITEIRAFGFSKSGRFLVLASCSPKMTKPTSEDISRLSRYFAATSNDEFWDISEKPLNPEDKQRVLITAFASLYH